MRRVVCIKDKTYIDCFDVNIENLHQNAEI